MRLLVTGGAGMLGQAVAAAATRLGHDVFALSRAELDITDPAALERAVEGSDFVVNAAAYTHSSWAIHDALATFDGPVVELHISNPERREPWRRTSVVTPVATGVICGFGGHGYRLAIEAVADLLEPST